MVKNAIHWFRKGLRLHDNPALLEAARGADTLRCVYFLDPWFAGSSNLGVNRWRFLLQCLEDLDVSLRKINSRLFVIRGQPANIFPGLFKEWKITQLTFECDSEPFGKERDAAIQKLASEAGVEVLSRTSHTLYDLDKIIELNGGHAPLTFKRFQTLMGSMPAPDPPVEALSRAHLGGCVTPVSKGHRDQYGVPLLEELGFDTEGLAPAVWPGGEMEALARIEAQLLAPELSTQVNMEGEQSSTSNPQQSSAPQQSPASQLSPASSPQQSSTPSPQQSPASSPQLSPAPSPQQSPLLCSSLDLSPYLRFGCLSCRLYYSKLAELNRKVKSKLLWREFFYTAATNNPRFDKMDGNPACIRIPWDRNPQALAKWAEAKTGFPWIDAIMTQLRQEGWIHPLARHAVACFLTRGDLWVSWEEGMKVFDELLLDADWSVNAGSWMCHSCSSFFQQFFHCYCPVGFGRRMDPSGDYVRRYLPAFKHFPAKYIYDPWNAPEDVQRAAGCVVGVDYPRPMVDHAQSSRLNIERMRQIYQQLSRYRGLSLLAAVPSAPTEDLNVNGNRGAMAPPAGKKHRGTSSHHGHREHREQVGPNGLKPGPTDQQSCRTSQAEQGGLTNQETRSGHEFVVPRHPGQRGRGERGVLGKREWEPGQEGGGDNDMASCALKVQRQNKQRSAGRHEESMAVSS